ncbi:MAG: hypothetical protein V1690_00735 [Candidatus Moraniibacteriota bacterium]
MANVSIGSLFGEEDARSREKQKNFPTRRRMMETYQILQMSDEMFLVGLFLVAIVFIVVKAVSPIFTTDWAKPKGGGADGDV